MNFTSPNLRFGYGCFETIQVNNGLIINFEKHLERLKLGCEILFINIKDFKQQEIIEFCKINCFKSTWVLRLVCTPDFNEIKYFVEPYIKKNRIQDYKIILNKQWRIDSRSPLNKFKSFNYLNRYIPYKEALQKGFYNVLLCNEKEEIVETSKANIFFQNSEGEWFTPLESSGCLPGIIRNQVIQELNVQEIKISINNLSIFKSVMLTNSLIGKLFINNLENNLII